MADYIPALPVLLSFALASAILTLTPGPDMTLFLSQTVSRSRAAGAVAYLGAATGLLLHTAFVALGLSALLVASATAFGILKVVGALYLLWLAVDALRNGSTLRLQKNGGARGSLGFVYLRGLLVNLLNPKVIIFFITFLPQFVSSADPFAVEKLFVLGALYVVFIATPMSLAMVMSAGRVAGLLTRSRRASRIVDWLFATVLGAFAIKLLATRAG